ncbi:hypothetical protein D6Z43_09840 [Pseudomonas sp. DY-1]|nr:hypothetical protein D6Z43_09840 [Pseudomonas sp. DY-1]
MPSCCLFLVGLDWLQFIGLQQRRWGVMKCFICGSEASQGASTGDYEWLACPACGEYKVTRSALELLSKNGWSFNVDESRRWIASYQGTGEIAVITADRAARLI